MGRPRLGVRSGLTLALAVIIGVAASWGLQTFLRPAQKLELSPVFEAALNDPGSPSVGGPDADVTVVIFTDYRCGICQATAPALARLLAKDQKVRVIYKDWPIRGPDSAVSARWALAAVYQGRYRAFHDALMASRGPLNETRILEMQARRALTFSACTATAWRERHRSRRRSDATVLRPSASDYRARPRT